MSINLFEVELANIVNSQLHRATENSENKRQNNQRRLAARRAVENHRERLRLREELDDWELELL